MNQEAAGPLNCPAEGVAGLPDLGLPRNLLLAPLGGAAGSSPGTRPAPNFRTARKPVPEGRYTLHFSLKLRAPGEGRGSCTPALGVAQDGMGRGPLHAEPGVVQTPRVAQTGKMQ